MRDYGKLISKPAAMLNVKLNPTWLRVRLMVFTRNIGEVVVNTPVPSQLIKIETK